MDITHDQTLSYEVLLTLASEWPTRRSYTYDLASLQKRAHERCHDHLLPYLKRFGVSKGRVLELGGRDGMASFLLSSHGHSAYVMDVQNRLEKSANPDRIHFVASDASQNFPLEEAFFDCVFSYNSFEHFHDPEVTLKECIRVLKPGGILVLDFGPLFESPWGLHAYKVLGVPYVQFLFSEDLIERYFKTQNCPYKISASFLNKWPIENYRAIWKSVEHDAAQVVLKETKVTVARDFIAKHPSLFPKNEENYLVDRIHTVFQKRKR